MRIAVVGAGGVGGYFGGRLAEHGHDVVFLVRGRTLAALRAHGLRVESINGDFAIRSVQATDNPRQIVPVDVVLVTVKAWQLEEAIAPLTPILRQQTPVVPLQNGMTAPEEIARVLGPEHAVGGLCGIVSYVVEPGHIRHSAVEPFIAFGELDNSRSERLTGLLDAFTAAAVNAEIPGDIHRAMWSKFLFIAPYSAVGACTRVPIGELRTMPEPRGLVERAVRELIAVAKASGFSFDDGAFDRTMQRYDGLAPESTNSLQRDIADGKPSELEAQVGAVVRMARAHHVAAPVFEVLYSALLPQERRARRQK